MRNLSLLLATASTAAALYATPALADQTYPGINCNVLGAAATGVRVSGRIFINDSTSNVNFQCPIVHEDRYPYGVIASGVSAFVVDRRIDDKVSCRLISQTVAGDEFDFSTDQTTDAHADTEPEALHFAAVSVVTRNSLVLVCTVPTRNGNGHYSGIISYTADESF